MKKEAYIELAKAILEEEYANFQGFEDLAERLELHPSYFSRLFKQVERQSPSSYLNALRIKKAKAFLEKETLDNEKLAFLVGFTQANYFVKVFRKYTGLSPQLYRKKYLHSSFGQKNDLDKQHVQADEKWLF